MNGLLSQPDLKRGSEQVKPSEDLLTKGNYGNCKISSRQQMSGTYSAVCTILAFAGTLFIRTIPCSGQRSFAIVRYSSPTAIGFTTCSVASICRRDDARTAFAIHREPQLELMKPIPPAGTRNDPAPPAFPKQTLAKCCYSNSKSLTSDFSSFSSATEASIFVRLKSLMGTPCTISHFLARTRTGNDEINSFSTS